MNSAAIVFNGVVHGKTIELDHAPGLPDGQPVTVTLCPSEAGQKLPPPGEGLRRAFGGWAEDGNALDEFLEWNRKQRKRSRGGIES
jgi:hypothetical protein